MFSLLTIWFIPFGKIPRIKYLLVDFQHWLDIYKTLIKSVSLPRPHGLGQLLVTCRYKTKPTNKLKNMIQG